jgi:hypothetical protein
MKKAPPGGGRVEGTRGELRAFSSGEGGTLERSGAGEWCRNWIDPSPSNPLGLLGFSGWRRRESKPRPARELNPREAYPVPPDSAAPLLRGFG